jgi:nitrite reductase/ring-hydroxylating ferredoxin subunit
MGADSRHTPVSTLNTFQNNALLRAATLMCIQSEIELVKIADISELPQCDQAKEFFGAGRALCVVNLGGEIHVMDNICPHWGGPLGRGKIENGKLRCPWHGWEFDPQTGETARKADVKLKKFPVKIEGEEVFIEMGTESISRK